MAPARHLNWPRRRRRLRRRCWGRPGGHLEPRGHMPAPVRELQPAITKSVQPLKRHMLKGTIRPLRPAGTSRPPRRCALPLCRRSQAQAAGAAGLHAGRGGAAQGRGRPLAHHQEQGQRPAQGARPAQSDFLLGSFGCGCCCCRPSLSYAVLHRMHAKRSTCTPLCRASASGHNAFLLVPPCCAAGVRCDGVYRAPPRRRRHLLARRRRLHRGLPRNPAPTHRVSAWVGCGSTVRHESQPVPCLQTPRKRIASGQPAAPCACSWLPCMLLALLPSLPLSLP